MREKPRLRALSDDELLRSLSDILKTSRWVEADLVAHIGEVDARRLYRREAAPSMFVYCTQRLHLSEQEAYLRIAVARASREHPVLLEMLRDGRMHLTGIGKLAPHLTAENRDELLARAVHKSKRQIEALVAQLAPQPAAATLIQKVSPAPAGGATAAAVELGPDRVDTAQAASDLDQADLTTWGLSSGQVVAGDGEHGPDPSPSSPPQLGPDRVAGPPPARSARVEPRAPDRFRVHFDASAELCEKLERLHALMRRSLPDADLAAIIEEAVTEKLKRLEARRFAKTKTPRKTLQDTDTAPKSRKAPAPVRRAVYERDGGQCTYTDDHGRRCPERDDLEYHHEGTPYGKNGDHSPGNIRLMCKAHNQLRAEEEYGEEVMARFRRPASGVSEPASVYAVRTPHVLQGGSLG